MSEKLEPTTSHPSTSSAEDSHVSQCRVPDSGKAQTTNGGSGLSSIASFASLDPDGFWVKMYQGCSQLMLDGSLEGYCETWPRAGTMRNGTAYRRRPLVPRTGGTGCSLWATPEAFDAQRAKMNHETMDSSRRHAKGGCRNLVEDVIRWPTPRASDSERGGRGELLHMAKGANTPRGPLWPTPRCNLVTQATDKGAGRDDSRLEDAIASTGARGQLNPTWVEWLMGFPLGWTDLKDSETQSCPKSPNGSDDGS